MSAAAIRTERKPRALPTEMPGAAALVFDRDLRIDSAEGPALADAGLDAAGLRGKTLRQVLGAAQADGVEPSYRRALEGSAFTLEHRVQGRWVVAHGAPRRDAQGRVEAVLATWVDISERKRSEDRMRRGSDCLLGLVRHAPFGICVVDSRLRLLHVSAGAQALFDNARPLIGRDIAEVLREIWPQPVADAALQRLRDTLASGERHQALGFSARRLDTAHPDSCAWVLERVRLNDDEHGVACYFHDATPRQQHGEAPSHRSEQHEHERAARDESERDAYRVGLEDALRPLDDPSAIMAAACRVLTTSLDANRVFYGEFDDSGEFVDVVAEVAPQLRSVAGRWPAQRFPTLMAALHSGQRIVLADLADVRGSLLPEAECAALRALDAAALVAVPLYKGEHCVAMVWAQRGRALPWTTDELWRIDTTAERTWAGVVRSRSELALQRSQQRFASLVSIVTDVPWTADARGAFATAQPAWQAYTGQDWEAHAGFGWLQAVHPGDREPLLAQWREAGEHSSGFEIEVRLRHAASAGWRTCRIRATPLLARDERVLEWVGSCDAVHADRRAAAELRAAARRKDEFLATLAHELRNPLAPVRTAARLMSLPGVDAAQLSRARAIIDRQTRHMSLLLDDLLDVARITQGKLRLKTQRLELAPVVDAAVEAAQPLIEARHHVLQLRLPATPVWLDADPVRLAQVLANLLTNAARYTAPGGRIELGAEAVADGALQITVADNGKGLSVDALDAIFTMFVQAGGDDNQSSGGLGIGLAIVKGLVELHGGTVHASSPGPGKGSRFVVTLPGVEGQAAGAGKVDAAPAASATRRVLVVDDNRDAADMLASYLRMNGHQVEVAQDGAGGLLKAQREWPDIALLDIGMPGMDGYTLARRLRETPQGRAMRLAALTGWGQTADQERAYAAGFDAHFTKPVNMDALCEWLAGNAARSRPAAGQIAPTLPVTGSTRPVM
jgi:signal transduction histidine kinase/CheY-like chemotaxis protein